MIDPTTSRDTIIIVYASGCYGHWIDWVINYFGFNKDYELPFNQANGNAHKMQHLMLSNLESYKRFVKGKKQFDVAGIHPGATQDQPLDKVLSEVCQQSKKVIFLTPDKNSLMLAWNNKWTKVRDDWFLPYQDSVTQNVRQWGKQSYSDMEVWEKREFLSFYWWPARLNEHQWGQIWERDEHWDSYPNFEHLPMLKITLSELRDDCPGTVLKILDYLGLELRHTQEHLIEVCNLWSSLQKHFCKDQLVKDIVSSVVNNNFFDWKEHSLTIIDEATIQMFLRDLHKLELKCYNVNTFPTNSTDLRNITFNA